VGESNTGDVLGVTSQRSGLSTFSGRVSVDLDETVVITTSDEHTVLGAVNTIDVSSIGTAGEDTLNIPRELGSLSGPSNTGGVASTRRILRAVVHLEEEELISTTVGADVRTINSPVKVSDIRIVGLKSTYKVVTILNIVDVDVVVMGTDCELLAIGRVVHNLDPLRGVLHQMLLSTSVTILDHNSTIVTSDSNVIVVNSDSSGALGVRQLAKLGSTTFLGLLLSVSDLEGVLSTSLGRIPSDNLVIVSRGVDVTLGIEIETPNFTVVMGVHDFLFVGTIRLAVDDSTRSQTNNHIGTVEVNSADEAVEIDLGLYLEVRGSGQNNATVLTTRVQDTIMPFHGANETLGVSLEGTSAATVFPLVDTRVGTTGVAEALVIPSNARHGGHFVGAEETLLLGRLVITIPEVDVLDTSSGESLGAGLSRPLNIHDTVGTTLVRHDEVALLHVEYMNIMVVVKINASEHGVVLGPTDGLNTSGTLLEFKFVHLFTSDGVPNEDSGSGADLTGDSHLSVGAQINRGDIVVMTIFIVTSLLGLVGNFTTTEEFLGVGVVVKDDTKSSSHVNDLTVLVDEAVLARVSASVTVDVVKSVSLIRLIIVDGVVIVRLSDLTNPRLNSHELFTFASIFDSE